MSDEKVAESGVIKMEAASAIIVTAALIIVYLIYAAIRVMFWHTKAGPLSYRPEHIGNITLEELSKCSGLDPQRPILFAVRGKVYDVTTAASFYGPGGSYQVFGGREISRALAKMAITEEECNDTLDDLTPQELETLSNWEKKFAAKYKVVGKVVPPMELSLKDLAQYDGTNPGKPILVSLRGVIFDVSKGREYYGPDGAYPFAGKECARAFAKFSTKLEDCTADTKGCTLAEMDALRDWEARLHMKYSVVGKLVD